MAALIRGSRQTVCWLLLCMNEHGAVIINENGAMVIDGSFIGLKVFAQGSTGSSGWPRKIEYSARSSCPMLAIKPGDRWVGFNAQDENYAWTTVWVFDPVSLDYALADVGGGLSDDTDFGMVVYNQNGDAVFDSREISLVIHDVITLGEFPVEYEFYADPPATASHAYVPGAYYLISAISGLRSLGIMIPEAIWTEDYVPCIRQASPTSVEYLAKMVGAIDGMADNTNGIPPGMKLIVCTIDGG